MHHVNIIAILAVLQFMYFGVLVGRARGQHGVPAPATSGHPLFERAFRVHMNTLEQLAAFLPALFIANAYWPGRYVTVAGVVYLLGRFLFQRAYVADPAKRGLGFLLTMLPTVVLLLAGLAGAARQILAL